MSHGSAFTKKTCDVVVNMTEKQGDKDAVLSGGGEKGRKKTATPQKKKQKNCYNSMRSTYGVRLEAYL